MKKLILTLGIFSLLTSCGPDYKAEVEKLKQEREVLLSQYNQKNNEINGYITDINEIQASIDELTNKERLLKQSTTKGVELSVPQKKQILSDIEAIKNLIEKNKSRIAGLQSKIRKSNEKVGELEKMVESLSQQLAEKDANIVLLNEQIAGLTSKLQNTETELVSVKTDNENKSKEISDKVIKLNTAYYAVGDYKTLRENKVISNEGNIFSKSKDIDPDFNSESFTRIDITKTQTISFTDSKKVELASVHPTNTYALVKDNDVIKGIQITNPERFWASSKYLVVVTK